MHPCGAPLLEGRTRLLVVLRGTIVTASVSLRAKTETETEEKLRLSISMRHFLPRHVQNIWGVEGPTRASRETFRVQTPLVARRDVTSRVASRALYVA